MIQGFNYSNFQQFLQMPQDTLHLLMYKYLKKHYKKVQQTKDYIVAEGDIPIALVAHLDTVLVTPPTADRIFYDRQKAVIWGLGGLGADDRAGVYAITSIIGSGLRPHIIFTTDEEIGGLGAEALSATPCPFKELKYIIQLDRKGSNDCVFYDCENLAFTKYIEKFGFKEKFGTFSDISFICPRWKIAGVNLSIGYYYEHTPQEFLRVNQMIHTIEAVKAMLVDAANVTQPFEYVSAYGDDLKTVHKCNNCGKYYLESEFIPIINKDKQVKQICSNCLDKIIEFVDWCPECGCFYSTKDFDYCPICC